MATFETLTRLVPALSDDAARDLVEQMIAEMQRGELAGGGRAPAGRCAYL